MHSARSKKEVIIYFANWNLKKKVPTQGGEVAGLPWDRVTYINHAFWAVAPVENPKEDSISRRKQGATPRTEFIIESMCPEFDMEDWTPSEIDPRLSRNHFSQYEVFSQKYPDVRIMISIGGWARCGFFSEMAYTSAGRASFIQSCVDLIERYPWIGGIDIDWEYPGCSTAGERLPNPNSEDGDQGCPIWGTAEEDSKNFTLLLKELRAALNDRFGKRSKKLTACAGASTTSILPMQDWASFAKYLDLINIMTYDIAGIWDGVTGHASGLKDTKKAVKYLTALGIPEEKLCIGSPLYAISFLMKHTPSGEIVGVPSEPYRASTKEITEAESRAFEYEAVPHDAIGWHKVYDSEAGATYLYNDNPNSPHYKWFLTYEDSTSLQGKLNYINKTDIAGIIVWEASQDTSDYDLISQMAEHLLDLN
ncbi:MAG: hypothetical protein K6G30_00690 [Acetatifactor sp.]|nr:hypothetical protein [Acetatifactor sp.]